MRCPANLHTPSSTHNRSGVDDLVFSVSRLTPDYGSSATRQFAISLIEEQKGCRVPLPLQLGDTIFTVAPTV